VLLRQRWCVLTGEPFRSSGGEDDPRGIMQPKHLMRMHSSDFVKYGAVAKNG
jgi:hypothetical protein